MNIVSLFSGCGGLDLGLIQAGHDIVWANDFDADSVATYTNNINAHAVLSPIEDIFSSFIAENVRGSSTLQILEFHKAGGA